MARVTVTVEGEAEEVRAALTALLGSASVDSFGSELRQEQRIASPQVASQSPWTSDELAHLWDYLTPSAQQVLARIAERPDGYPFTALEQDLGNEMQIIGGNLSSVGHAMRRLYKTEDGYLKPWPITKDANMRRYVMDEDVAKMIRELSAEMRQDE